MNQVDSVRVHLLLPSSLPLLPRFLPPPSRRLERTQWKNPFCVCKPSRQKLTNLDHVTPELTVELHWPSQILTAGQQIPFLLVLKPETPAQLVPPLTYSLRHVSRRGASLDSTFTSQTRSSTLSDNWNPDICSIVAVTLVQLVQGEETNLQASEPRQTLLCQANLTELAGLPSSPQNWRILQGNLVIPHDIVPSFRCAAVCVKHAIKVDLLPWSKVTRVTSPPSSRPSTSSSLPSPPGVPRSTGAPTISLDELMGNTFRLHKTFGAVWVDIKVQQ